MHSGVDGGRTEQLLACDNTSTCAGSAVETPPGQRLLEGPHLRSAAPKSGSTPVDESKTQPPRDERSASSSSHVKDTKSSRPRIAIARRTLWHQGHALPTYRWYLQQASRRKGRRGLHAAARSDTLSVDKRHLLWGQWRPVLCAVDIHSGYKPSMTRRRAHLLRSNGNPGDPIWLPKA